MIENSVHFGDSEDVLKTFPDECIDLCVTSCPYDNLRDYDKDKVQWNFDKFKTISTEICRVLKKNGTIVWVVGDSTIQGSETGNSFRQVLYFIDVLKMNLHDTMIYEKNGASFPARRDGNRYTQIFEYMFVFSKGKPRVANLICDKQNTWEGWTSFGQCKQRNKDGELSNRYKKPTPKFSPRNNIWKYNTGRNYTTKDVYAFEHPAMFPEQLAKDHILTWSNEDDIVLDPFAGAGTVGKMAKMYKRKYILIEAVEKYVEIIKKRLIVQTKLF